MSVEIRRGLFWIFQRFVQLPIRSRVTLPLFIALFILNILLFHFIEDYSWITSIYFVIILLSTIGFGDVVPSTDLTRVFVILLVIVGFTTFAFVADDIFDNIIRERMSTKGAIPLKPLSVKDHIIIGGYGSKGRRVAELLKDRGFKIIISEIVPESAQLAIAAGYRTIIADISKIDILEKLSLDQSRGIFLLLNDDDVTIHAAIHARSLSNSVTVYAELIHPESYEIAKFVGINNPVLQSTSIASKIRELLSEGNWKVPHDTRTLVSQRSHIGYLQSKYLKKIGEEFRTSYLLGTVNISLNTIETVGELSEFDIHSDLDQYEYLFSVDRDELGMRYGTGKSLLFNENRSIIVAGYNPVVKDVLQKLNLPDRKITVLWTDLDEYELTVEDGHSPIKWEAAKSTEILSSLVKEGDIILSFFENVTDALLLSLSLKKTNLDHTIIQIVLYEREIKPFIRVGASYVIPVQFTIAELILKEFFNDSHIPPSLFYGNRHLFEQLIDQDNLTHWKRRLKKIQKDDVAFILSKNGSYERYESHKLTEGDRLLFIFKKRLSHHSS